MQDVLTLVFPVLLLVVLGAAAQRYGRTPPSAVTLLNDFVCYVALPALFLRGMLVTPPALLFNLSFVAATTFTTYIVFALAFFIGVLATQGSIPETSILATSGSLSSNPMLAGGTAVIVLGASAVAPVALIAACDSLLVLITVPLLMRAAGVGGSTWESYLRDTGRAITTNPIILSVVLGLLLSLLRVPIPGSINLLLQLLGQAAVPLGLIAIGIQLADMPKLNFYAEMPVLLAVKLVVHPILVFALLRWISHVNAVWIAAAVVTAALPPSVEVLSIARQYGLRTRQAQATLVVGSIVAIVTVACFMWALSSGPMRASV